MESKNKLSPVSKKDGKPRPEPDLTVPFKLCQFIVGKFLKYDNNKCKINWPREMKIAQKLIKIYPDCQLWQGVSVPPAMGSLSFFLTEEGKLTLRLASNSKILSEKIENKQTRSLHIQSEKVGEDRILPDKPKTLLEFLRKDYGKTKED